MLLLSLPTFHLAVCCRDRSSVGGLRVILNIARVLTGIFRRPSANWQVGLGRVYLTRVTVPAGESAAWIAGDPAGIYVPVVNFLARRS